MKFYLLNNKKNDFVWITDLVMRTLRLNICENEKRILVCLIFFDDGFCVDSEFLSLRCGLSEFETRVSILGLINKNFLIVNNDNYSVQINFSFFLEIKNEKRKQALFEEQGTLSDALSIKMPYFDTSEINI